LSKPEPYTGCSALEEEEEEEEEEGEVWCQPIGLMQVVWMFGEGCVRWSVLEPYI